MAIDLSPNREPSLSIDPSRQFTVAVIPDTQVYTSKDNGIFEQITRWIVDNRQQYNIKTVIHVGDVVSSQGQDEAENAIAADAMNRLKQAGLPTVVSLGNHDARDMREPTWFREQFSTSWYEELIAASGTVTDMGTYEGHAENLYLVQELMGEEFLFMTYEYLPRDEVMDWVQATLDEHNDKHAMLVTHTYLDNTTGEHDDRVRYLSGGNYEENANSGKEQWEGWLRKSENLRYHVCGHWHGSGHANCNAKRVDETTNDTRVAQHLHNYQSYGDTGGDGFFRLLRVDIVDWWAESYTYSPPRDEWASHELARFESNLADHWLDEYEQTGLVKTVPRPVEGGETAFVSANGAADPTVAGGVTRRDSGLALDPDSVQHTTASENQESNVLRFGGEDGTVAVTQVRQATPETSYGDATSITIDGADDGGEVHGLVRFPGLFGDGNEQLSSGSGIEAAELVLSVHNEGDGIAAHRLLTEWSGEETWTSLRGGIQPDGDEAVTDPVASAEGVGVGTLRLDVTAAVTAWIEGADNHGFALLPLGSNGTDIYTEHGSDPPVLAVLPADS
jgi:hypothetical protein